MSDWFIHRYFVIAPDSAKKELLSSNITAKKYSSMQFNSFKTSKTKFENMNIGFVR